MTPDWIPFPASDGECLRKWALSEVWRVRTAGPDARTVIVKRGDGGMDEVRRYRALVEPLGLPAPALLDPGSGDPAVFVLADAGPESLEQRPSPEGYRAAVRTLARMRRRAADGLAADPSIGAGLRWSAADFTGHAERAAAGVAALRPDLRGRLDDPVRELARRLRDERPATVVHNDFHAKNLVHDGRGGLTVVDWPLAYVHHHLGDLFCLLREARMRGRPTDGLIELYATEAGRPAAQVTDDLRTGGLCWAFLLLRWIVEEGVTVAPDMVGDIDELAGVVLGEP